MIKNRQIKILCKFYLRMNINYMFYLLLNGNLVTCFFTKANFRKQVYAYSVYQEIISYLNKYNCINLFFYINIFFLYIKLFFYNVTIRIYNPGKFLFEIYMIRITFSVSLVYTSSLTSKSVIFIGFIRDRK